MGKRKGNPLGAVLRTLGTLLLLLLVAACLPLTVPRLFGYQIYAVISGSMEPALPIGSLVYIQGVEPAEVKEGDVIAFYGAGEGGAVVTHRVLENRTLMGEFVTKGDANPQEDLAPVPYARYIGTAAHSIPGVGALAEFLTGPKGKAAAGGVIAAAVALQLLASAAERTGRRE